MEEYFVVSHFSKGGLRILRCILLLLLRLRFLFKISIIFRNRNPLRGSINRGLFLPCPSCLKSIGRDLGPL